MSESAGKSFERDRKPMGQAFASVDAEAYARRIPIRLLPPRVRNILDLIARKHGLLAEDILERDRHGDVVAARREAIRRIRDELKLSTPRIGQMLGLRHTSVLHHLPKGPPKPAKRAADHDWSVPDESGVWAI